MTTAHSSHLSNTEAEHVRALSHIYGTDPRVGRVAIIDWIRSVITSRQNESLTGCAHVFLAISEIPHIEEDLHSFCIDAMLFAEGDLHGDFKSVSELSAGLMKLEEQ